MNFSKTNICSISVLLTLLFSCSGINPNSQKNTINKNKWIEHCLPYPDAGFVLKFMYPNNIIVADMIDNCICVGIRTKFYDENEASENDNTRQWCICTHDTADITSDYLISSWKSLYNGQVVEQRDSVTIEDLKALRVTLKSKTKNASDRQLIYLKKYSTLFEIMNIYEGTEKDFETFYKSIKIEEYKRKQ